MFIKLYTIYIIMIFSNKRSYIPTVNNNPKPQMNFTFTPQKPRESTLHSTTTSATLNNSAKAGTVARPLAANTEKVPVTIRSPIYVEKAELAKESDSDKIKWGKPFWTLFHVMAEKVKESDFQRIRAELLSLIYLICSNLPCPDCTTHAVTYLNGINFNAIKTKEDLKNMLFEFHNSVNARKGYALFPRSDLERKYRSGTTRVIIENFLDHFKSRPYSVRLFTDTLHRDRVMKKLITWFESNITCFQ